MPTLCDVNFLVAIIYQGHVHHPKALDWFSQQDDLSVILCRNTQLNCLRLLCNSIVMGDDVCSMRRAWDAYDRTSSDIRFEFAAEPVNLEPFLRKFTQLDTPSPKVWQDGYLAAFACAANYRFVTFDDGFKKFDGLQLILLEK